MLAVNNASLDVRRRQEAIDEFNQASCVIQYAAQVRHETCAGAVRHVLHQHLAIADDMVERRAQLVTQV